MSAFTYFSVYSTSLGTAMSTRNFGPIFKNQIMATWEREKEQDSISMCRGIRQGSHRTYQSTDTPYCILHDHRGLFLGGFWDFFYLTDV